MRCSVKKCRKCGKEKPLSEFYRRHRGSDERTAYCKDCTKSGVNEWVQGNRERVAAKQRGYYEANKVACKEKAKQWAAKQASRRREICKRSKQRQWKRLRDAVYAAYGGYCCVCCGESEPMFLTIDHIDNDGAAHRKGELKKCQSLYHWLKDHGFPPGFQVLCRNCNWGKHVNGGVCPHQCKARGQAAEEKGGA